MLDQTVTNTSLKLKYFFEAPLQRVFAAWTRPAALLAWFRVAPDFRTTVAEVDLRPGGRYRIGMQPPGAEAPQVASGEYRHIEPPKKLIFTWRWEGSPEPETLVTLEFIDRRGGTELILTHEKFTEKAARELHTQGWHGCLAQLGGYLKQKEG